jgi:hypothetical protein
MVAARAICRKQDRHLAQAESKSAGRAINTQIMEAFEVFLANFAAPIP